MDSPCCYEVLRQTPEIIFWKTLCLNVTINICFKAIIWYWDMHNMRVSKNPIVKSFFYPLFFCISSLIWYTVPQHTACSYCLAISLRSIQPENRSLRFDVRWFWKMTEWFSIHPQTWVLVIYQVQVDMMSVLVSQPSQVTWFSSTSNNLPHSQRQLWNIG